MRLYFRMWNISMILDFLGRRRSCFGHLVLICHSLTFLFYLDNSSFFFLPIFLMSFDKRIMLVCGDIMGPRSWEFIQDPLVRCQVWLSISFGGICPFIYGGLCPFAFLGSLIWWLHIYAPGFIFLIDLFWKNMLIELKGAHTSFSHAFV